MRRRAGGRLTADGRRAVDGLMGLGLFAREWERTCSECGYTWRVPRSIARRGIRGMSAWTVRRATAGPMHDTSNVGALSADIEARAELMEGFRIRKARAGRHITGPRYLSPDNLAFHDQATRHYLLAM